MEDIKYLYNPEVRDIYLWNNRGVTLEDAAYGHVAVLTISGKYIDHLDQYGHELEEIEKNKIGKVIRPRWDKYIRTWQWQKRGLRHDELVQS